MTFLPAKLAESLSLTRYQLVPPSRLPWPPPDSWVMKVVKSLAACGMPTVSHRLSSKFGIAPSSPLGNGAYTVRSLGLTIDCLVYFHGRPPRLMSWRSDGATVTACAVRVAPRKTVASMLASRLRWVEL